MRLVLANWLNPALDNAWRTVMLGSMDVAPGCMTSPTRKIRLLLMEVTTTVTCGSAMYFFSFSVTDSANCLGVRPAACTSSSKGREILPSGRTGRVAVRSASFHTAMWRPSSGPMTYVGPAGLVEGAGVVLSEAVVLEVVLAEAVLAAGVAGTSCANARLPIKISAANAAFHVDLISSPKFLFPFFRPFGACSIPTCHPRLTPWAAFLRRFAAWFSCTHKHPHAPYSSHPICFSL